MSESIQLALTLMIIGMITVFIILLLVVVGGKVLISAVNRFGAEVEKIKPAVPSNEEEEIPVAILTAVVQHLSNGRGTITRIEKLE